jgi:hypothetical protein
MQFSAAPVSFPTSRYLHLQPIVAECTLQSKLTKRRLYTSFSIKDCAHSSAFWTDKKTGFIVAHLCCSCVSANIRDNPRFFTKQ